MGDHVHMLVSIPPEYAISQVVGYIKGKSAIHIARTYAGRRHNYVGQSFWARGYFVSTVGRDEGTVRKYIKKQEEFEMFVFCFSNILTHPDTGTMRLWNPSFTDKGMSHP